MDYHKGSEAAEMAVSCVRLGGGYVVSVAQSNITTTLVYFSIIIKN